VPQPSARKDRWKSLPSLHLLYSSRHSPGPLRVGFTPPSDESDGVLTRAGKRKFSIVTLVIFRSPRLLLGSILERPTITFALFKPHSFALLINVTRYSRIIAIKHKFVIPAAHLNLLRISASHRKDNLASVHIVFTAASTHGAKMGQKFDSRISSRVIKRKKPSRRTPSSKELSEQYFGLVCLRQKVRIAESGRVVGRELIRSPALASFV
jgi:hypothetical protein